MIAKPFSWLKARKGRQETEKVSAIQKMMRLQKLSPPKKNMEW